MECIMTKESTLKNKVPQFFSEERELIALVPLHKWLLISACVLIFIVLPLLFIWSSLGIIHPQGYDQGILFSDSGQMKITSSDESKLDSYRNQIEFN